MRFLRQTDLVLVSLTNYLFLYSPRTSAKRIHGSDTGRRASVHVEASRCCCVPILLTTFPPPPPPREPQRIVFIAAVRGAVRPSKKLLYHARLFILPPRPRALCQTVVERSAPGL